VELAGLEPATSPVRSSGQVFNSRKHSLGVAWQGPDSAGEERARRAAAERKVTVRELGTDWLCC
jgi:hypothetical protein